jgi:hypothetical protein
MKITNSISRPLVALAALAAIGAGAGATAIASAATDTAGAAQTQAHRGPGIRGTIASISGTTIAVTDKISGTTYTVDASSAKVMIGKGGAAPAAGSVSDLSVGDEIGVRGTVSGTDVSAQDIMSGKFRHGLGMGGRGVRGTVSAINGSTLTITNTDGTSYTVDAGQAKVQKTAEINLSDVRVGDTVGVMGDVSGTSVTARHIMDGVPDGHGPPAAK